VIADPAAALPILTEKARRASGGKGGRSDRQRLASAVSWSIRSLREALLQLNSSNPGEFAEAELPLKQLEQTLRESFWAVCMALLKLGDRSAMLDEWRRLLGALGVSPGKQEKSG
jgi:hypothetical protein